jgi:hypothetical protein
VTFKGLFRKLPHHFFIIHHEDRSGAVECGVAARNLRLFNRALNGWEQHREAAPFARRAADSDCALVTPQDSEPTAILLCGEG